MPWVFLATAACVSRAGTLPLLGLAIGFFLRYASRIIRKSYDKLGLSFRHVILHGPSSLDWATLNALLGALVYLRCGPVCVY